MAAAAARLCSRARGSYARIRSMFMPCYKHPCGDELKMQLQQKKEELFDLLILVKATQAYRPLSRADFQNSRLINNLAVQLEPKTHIVRRYRVTRRIVDFAMLYCYLKLQYLLHSSRSVEEQDEGPKGTEDNNSEVHIETTSNTQ